jgi:8-oxo-dGTP diphosphatase
MQANKQTEESIKVNVVAGVVLRKDNTFLMLEQAKESAKGQWGLPAGKIQAGETAEQAAIREAKEECGYDVKLVQELGVYHPKLTGPVKHIFLAEVVGGEEKLDPAEIASAAWLTLDEVEERKDKMRDSSIYTALVAAANA